MFFLELSVFLTDRWVPNLVDICPMLPMLPLSSLRPFGIAGSDNVGLLILG